MENLGVPYVETEAEVNGQSRVIRGYADDPVTAAQLKGCNDEIADAHLTQTVSGVALHDGYVRTVELVRCMTDKGHDMGLVVSEAEFVSSTGSAMLSSNWADLAASLDPEVQADWKNCTDAMLLAIPDDQK